jgi:hypothetical protein
LIEEYYRFIHLTDYRCYKATLDARCRSCLPNLTTRYLLRGSAQTQQLLHQPLVRCAKCDLDFRSRFAAQVKNAKSKEREDNINPQGIFASTAPPRLVDHVWHAHLDCARAYERFRRERALCFHHLPLPMLGPLSSECTIDVEAMFRDYEALFGGSAPNQVWGSLSEEKSPVCLGGNYLYETFYFEDKQWRRVAVRSQAEG